MAKVTIGLPNQNNFHKHVVVSLIEMVSKYSRGHELTLNMQTASPIDNCRNMIIRDFLESDSQFLVFVDSDNPPPSNVLDLVDLDLDIIIAPTLIMHSDLWTNGQGRIPMHWNTFVWSERDDRWTDHKNHNGLQEIDAGGTGCIIIARRVLEQVKPAFYRTWHEDGTVDKGSDLLFCQRAKEAGFRVWAHYDYRCGHFKTVNLKTLNEMLAARDIVHTLSENINTPDYWDEQWRSRSAATKPYFPTVCQVVDNYAKYKGCEVRVLDFGCGRGDLMALLASIPNVVVRGIDYSPVAVEICKSRGLGAIVGTEKDLSNPYDVIVATSVLEHVDDDQELIDQLQFYCDKFVYSVPWNCLPPGLEREHRRVYTMEYCQRITPAWQAIHECANNLVVESGMSKCHWTGERTTVRPEKC